MTITKTYRLRKNKEFSKVYKVGKSFANWALVVYLRENGLSYNRLGISVSKKVGKSVVRNRLRRLIKENYRNYIDEIKTGYDIIFIVRIASKDANFYDMKKGMEKLLKRASMFK